MADRDSSENHVAAEVKPQRLLAAGVIGLSATDRRPVASGQTRPRPRRSASDLLGDQRR